MFSLVSVVLFVLIGTKLSLSDEMNKVVIVSATTCSQISDNQSKEIKELENKLATLGSQLSKMQNTYRENSAVLTELKLEVPEFPKNCKEVQKRNNNSYNIYHIQPETAHQPFLLQSEVLDSSEDYPTDCKAVLDQRYNTSGFYYIQPQNAPEPFLVWCNMESSGGGWTTILNRVDGSQDFYLDWDSYKEGFGNIADEFWLGLEKIHYMAGYETVELLFELVDWDDVQADAHYDYFGIGNEEEGYTLKLVTGFSGVAGDAFSDLASMKFSTRDKDQDVAPDMHCAETSRGGWWFRYCKSGNPTGEYADNGDGTADNYYACMFWETWHPFEYCLKEIRMMIRPKV